MPRFGFASSGFRGVALALAAALVGFGIFSLKDRFGHPVRAKPQAQKIVMLRPPPPEPKPPEPKPPEPKPEPLQELLPQPEPEPPPPQAEEPPPGEPLGVDAAANGAGDAFGLVGRPGGKGLLGGGGGHALIWYAQQLQKEIEAELRRHVGEAARHSGYSVVARVWLGPDGKVARAELGSSSGDPGLDTALGAALRRLAGPFRAPPLDLPQPVVMRIRTPGG